MNSHTKRHFVSLLNSFLNTRRRKNVWRLAAITRQSTDIPPRHTTGPVQVQHPPVLVCCGAGLIVSQIEHRRERGHRKRQRVMKFWCGDGLRCPQCKGHPWYRGMLRKWRARYKWVYFSTVPWHVRCSPGSRTTVSQTQEKILLVKHSLPSQLLPVL